MTKRRQRRVVLFVTGVLIAASLAQVAAIAPAAGVSGLVRIASARSADNSNGLKSASAVCPAGKRVVGGGAVINDHGAGEVMLSAAHPMKSDSTYRYDVIGQEPDGGFMGAWWIQAFALCAGPLAGYALVTRSTGEFSSATFQSAVVECPAGTKALSAGGLVVASGGGVASNVGLQLVRPSGPLDIARATGREGPGGSAASWQVLTFAICAKPIADTVVASQVVTDVRSAAVKCPDGTVVHGAGGGGSVTDAGETYLQTLKPRSSLLRAKVKMTTAPAAGMVAQVVCAP